MHGMSLRPSDAPLANLQVSCCDALQLPLAVMQTAKVTRIYSTAVAGPDLYTFMVCLEKP